MPGEWKPPTALRQQQGLGSLTATHYGAGTTAEFLRSLNLVFTPDPSDFPNIQIPQTGDWLFERNVGDQSFDQYVQGLPRKPTPFKNCLYFLPLRDDDRLGTLLPIFQAVCEAFFLLPVKILPVKPIMGSVKWRTNDGVRQCHAGNILTALRKELPPDGICILGVTMVDLFPRDSWDYVFGLANTMGGVGVFSFARHDARFPDGGPLAELSPPQMAYLVQRSCDTLVHETSHMFGLKHCTYYSCIMQGHNGEESQERFFDLCPVCLRKLHWCLGFDVVTRYLKMLEVAPTERNAKWLSRRVMTLTDRGVSSTAIRAVAKPRRASSKPTLPAKGQVPPKPGARLQRRTSIN
jgi:archaemetzincin